MLTLARRRGERKARGTAVFLMALLAAGCSSGSSSGAAATATTGPASATSSSGGAPAGGHPSAPGTTADRFCELAKPLNNLDIAGSQQPGGASTLRSQFDQVAADEGPLLASAPESIKADLTTLFNTFNSLRSQLAGVGYSYSKLPPSYLQSLASQSREVTAASARVTSYLEQRCGSSPGSAAGAAGG